MNKQEFIEITGKESDFFDEFKAKYNSPELMWTFITEKVIPEAIAEHEAKQWHPYPENKPESYDGWFLCQQEDGNYIVLKRGDFEDYDVIAFCELPEPYKEGEPCPNCKETVNPCKCLRNICIRCGKPVGNITFTVCDACWDKKEGGEG